MFSKPLTLLATFVAATTLQGVAAVPVSGSGSGTGGESCAIMNPFMVPEDQAYPDADPYAGPVNGTAALNTREEHGLGRRLVGVDDIAVLTIVAMAVVGKGVFSGTRALHNAVSSKLYKNKLGASCAESFNPGTAEQRAKEGYVLLTDVETTRHPRSDPSYAPMRASVGMLNHDKVTSSSFFLFLDDAKEGQKNKLPWWKHGSTWKAIIGRRKAEMRLSITQRAGMLNTDWIQGYNPDYDTAGGSDAQATAYAQVLTNFWAGMAWNAWSQQRGGDPTLLSSVSWSWVNDPNTIATLKEVASQSRWGLECKQGADDHLCTKVLDTKVGQETQKFLKYGRGTLKETQITYIHFEKQATTTNVVTQKREEAWWVRFDIL